MRATRPLLLVEVKGKVKVCVCVCVNSHYDRPTHIDSFLFCMCGYKDLLNLRGREIYPFLRESVQIWKVWAFAPVYLFIHSIHFYSQ